MWTISSGALLVIMVVFVAFGGFAAGWNAGYRYRDHEAKKMERKQNQRIADLSARRTISWENQSIHVYELKASTDLQDEFINGHGFARAQQIANDSLSHELATKVLSYADMHMEHDAAERKYVFKARLRILLNGAENEALWIPRAWKQFDD